MSSKHSIPKAEEFNDVFIEIGQKLSESNTTPQNLKNIVENENKPEEIKTALIVRTKVTTLYKKTNPVIFELLIFFFNQYVKLS